MNKTYTVPIVIPAYEPEKKLLEFYAELESKGFQNIIVINDGSADSYTKLFEEIKARGGVILKHALNQGKGRALKTAFNYILNEFPDACGCITADSDGQHKTEDVEKCARALTENRDCLILGCRDFSGDCVPWKSRFGNELTRKVCSYLCGIKVSDTQTGLRGIPSGFMKELLNVPGERFEFETNMLISSKEKYTIIEVPIQTVYESKVNHRTHFDPVIDSVKIYCIFGIIFLKYILSSLSSSIIDIILFGMFCFVLKPWNTFYYITIATVLARIFSASYNYLINYKLVFHSKKNMGISGFKYLILAVCIMLLSALFVTAGAGFMPAVPETVIKMLADTALFLVSYKVQQLLIY